MVRWARLENLKWLCDAEKDCPDQDRAALIDRLNA
jgi:hypothetical protein